MTDCSLLIQILETPDGESEKPLLRKLQQRLPELLTFGFDNFSEESIRQYALDLIRQSRKAAIVVQVQTKNGATSALIDFFNDLQQLKHPQVLLVQEGDLEVPLHRLMHNIGGPQFEEAATDLESIQYILKFMQSP